MTQAGDPPRSEVLSDRLPPAWRERLGRTVPPWRRRVAALVVLVAVGLAAAHALQRPPGPAPATPRVLAVTVEVPPPGLRTETVPQVVATYRITSAPGSSVHLSGVTGPLVASSDARREGPGVFRVSATPDCRRLSTPRAGRYDVPGVRRSPVDWDAALRQVCWQQRATDGIDVVRLDARPDPRQRQLVLTVTLRSRLAGDVAIGVLDVADVATLQASDTGVLPRAASTVLRVRWPVDDCAVPALPQHTFVATTETPGQTVPALEWSVGRPGTDPSALFVTPLTRGQLSAVRAALVRLCTPPGTSIAVRAARTLAPSPVVRDLTGVSIQVRLSVVSTAPRVVLGTAPTGQTADARVGISAADVRPASRRTTAVVVWRARCGSGDPAPPVLPVGLSDGNRLARYAVTLDAPILAREYADACGLGRGRLRRAGWRAT